MANSPDIWNAVNGLNQQGYESAPAHQTQQGGYGNLEAAHAHMVRLPPPSVTSVVLLLPGSPEVKSRSSLLAGLLRPTLGASG